MSDTFDGIVCIDLLHISSWRACEGLMGGARQLLERRSFVYTFADNLALVLRVSP